MAGIALTGSRNARRVRKPPDEGRLLQTSASFVPVLSPILRGLGDELGLDLPVPEMAAIVRATLGLLS